MCLYHRLVVLKILNLNIEMKKTGIQLVGPGDLKIMNGSIQIGDTLFQNQYLILKSQKGDLKEQPLLGAGIDGLANDNDLVAWKKTIREELQRDGMKVSQLDINQSEIILKADYV